MEVNTEFLNEYIQLLQEELNNATKDRIFLKTRLSMSEKTLNDSVQLQNKLQQANNELMEKLKALEEEKKEAKASAKAK